MYQGQTILKRIFIGQGAYVGRQLSKAVANTAAAPQVFTECGDAGPPKTPTVVPTSMLPSKLRQFGISDQQIAELPVCFFL